MVASRAGLWLKTETAANQTASNSNNAKPPVALQHAGAG